MAIGYVTTANTFQQWLIATQDLITTANNLTDGGGSATFYANTNLAVGNNFTVAGDATVTGNLSVGLISSITITTANITNANISTLTANVSSLNLTNQLNVGTNANVYGTLYVAGDATFGGNVTLDTVGFDDLAVNGSTTIANTLSVTGVTTLSNTLTVTGNTTLSNVAVSGTANISTVISATGLLTTTTNVFVNEWVFSPNANVKSGVTTLSVVNSGSSAYLFDQYSGNNPDIYLHPGQTISFNINAVGHPFLIRETSGGTLYNIGLTHVSTTGVVTTESSAQGQTTGTLIWKVPHILTGNTYVYQCQNHAGMVGNLIIQPTVTSVNTLATAAFSLATGSDATALAFAIALG